MDGREAKANNFALLCIEPVRANKNVPNSKFHNETLSIFVICRHKMFRLKKKPWFCRVGKYFCFDEYDLQASRKGLKISYKSSKGYF